MKKYLPIMFVGTGSDVGKSVINAGFCRVFKQDGLNPAPFKAQNMSLNSYPTPDGLEIGRAQAVQAEACGIESQVEMNPVLIKPTGDKDAQIVLNGKPWGNRSASEYFTGQNLDLLFGEAQKAFETLASKYTPVVIEGAGSISEINLWDRDITNMRMAVETGAATFLIADIDRGGVFGSVYGTLELLPEKEKKQIKGIIINKFRGDISLFEDGAKKLGELCGIPVVGVIPYFRDIYLDEEDSVVVDRKQFASQEGKVNVAVVLLPHMSNFTDFNYMEMIPEVNLFYAATPLDLEAADVIIIPGSKNTIADLLYLQKKGMAAGVKKAHREGKGVYGICGGYQMMGDWICDPMALEGDVERVPGLGILPVETTITSEKQTEQCEFTFLQGSVRGGGYEIHMGETSCKNPNPLCMIEGNRPDGYFLNPRTWGTYIHGIFDNPGIVNFILQQVNGKVNVSIDFQQFKNNQYNKLADLIRENINMDYVYRCMES